MSLAILKREAATVFTAPDISTTASWAASASNLLGAVWKAMPVISATFSAKASAKPTLAFSPVPTAVPPWASARMLGSARSTRSMPWETCQT